MRDDLWGQKEVLGVADNGEQLDCWQEKCRGRRRSWFELNKGEVVRKLLCLVLLPFLVLHVGAYQHPVCCFPGILCSDKNSVLLFDVPSQSPSLRAVHSKAEQPKYQLLVICSL